MIKIKIYVIAKYWKRVGNMSIPVFDFNYTITFFGLIIHSLIIREIDHNTSRLMFKNKQIITKQ